MGMARRGAGVRMRRGVRRRGRMGSGRGKRRDLPRRVYKQVRYLQRRAAPRPLRPTRRPRRLQLQSRARPLPMPAPKLHTLRALCTLRQSHHPAAAHPQHHPRHPCPATETVTSHFHLPQIPRQPTRPTTPLRHHYLPRPPHHPSTCPSASRSPLRNMPPQTLHRLARCLQQSRTILRSRRIQYSLHPR